MVTRILVVDDQPELRKLVRLTLELENFEVYEAESGQHCLELLPVITPSLVIMDAMMPGRYDGFQACEKIKLRTPNVKVLMLTARAQKADIELGKHVMCDAYITKPFSPLALLEEVNSLISSRMEA